MMPGRRIRSDAALWIVLAAVAPLAVRAEAPPPGLSPPLVLSGVPVAGYDGDDADKGRIDRLVYPAPGGGFEKVLLAVYVDGQGGDAWGILFAPRPARDLFVTRSTDDGATWSGPVDVSGTAASSSILADHDGDPATPAVPFHGESERPSLASNGRLAILAWVDHYCPGSEQRTVVHPDLGGVEVAYGCVYVTRTRDGGVTWEAPERLTTGLRDPKQIVARLTGAGVAIAWQEDPQGLQPGEAEGPGEGASGALVSKGTDIWYTALPTAAFDAGAAFPAPVRISDNFTRMGTGTEEGYESGESGASRAALALIGSRAVVAYEETKGTGVPGAGKLVRLHAFSAFDASAPDPTGGAGWIVSNPVENGRRARVVPQPGQLMGASRVRMMLLWREGEFDQGGPADIMGRLGVVDSGDPSSTGLRPEDLVPAVAPGSTDPAVAESNPPGWNLSSDAGLDAPTSLSPYEDARGHRAVVRGDFIAFGYLYTPDWAVARYTDMENYDYLLRVSRDAGATWEPAFDVSALPDASVHAIEPRLVGTPFTSDPSEVNDPSVLYVAWGTQVNEYDHLSQGSIDLDLYVSWSTDRGRTFSPVHVLAGGDAAQYEVQLRTTPSGDVFHAVWQEAALSGGTDTLFATPEPERSLLALAALGTLTLLVRRARTRRVG